LAAADEVFGQQRGDIILAHRLEAARGSEGLLKNLHRVAASDYDAGRQVHSANLLLLRIEDDPGPEKVLWEIVDSAAPSFARAVNNP